MGDLHVGVQIAALRERAVAVFALVVFAFVVDRGTMCFEIEALHERRGTAGGIALERTTALMDSSVMTEEVVTQAKNGGTLLAFEHASLSFHVDFLNLR